MLGNGRLEAMCFDGVKRLCHIRGKLRKKVNFGKQTSFNPPKSNPTNTTFMFSPKTFRGNKLVITLWQVWINQSDIVLIGLRDYQVNQN